VENDRLLPAEPSQHQRREKVSFTFLEGKKNVRRTSAEKPRKKKSVLKRRRVFLSQESLSS